MLKVDSISKVHHLGEIEVFALKNVSLKIEEKDMICLMGRSGAGKSTLLRILGLLDFPTSGSIILDKIQVTEIKDKDRSLLRLKKIGYVFQDFALLQELTAIENVLLPAFMLSGNKYELKDRAIELLTLVGLAERIDHYPRQLSGGEQQRVAIARSLINSPKIIFADEPCANLDSLNARHVMELLRKINEELKTSIIFVSHDPEDCKYASKIIYLKDGEIVEAL